MKLTLTNCHVRSVWNVHGKGTSKRKITIVTREYAKENNKYVIYNKLFDDYDNAEDEVVKVFAEMGAYI